MTGREAATKSGEKLERDVIGAISNEFNLKPIRAAKLSNIDERNTYLIKQPYYKNNLKVGKQLSRSDVGLLSPVYTMICECKRQHKDGSVDEKLEAIVLRYWSGKYKWIYFDCSPQRHSPKVFAKEFHLVVDGTGFKNNLIKETKRCLESYNYAHKIHPVFSKIKLKRHQESQPAKLFVSVEDHLNYIKYKLQRTMLIKPAILFRPTVQRMLFEA